MNENHHLLWIAREFGDSAYVPLTSQDLETLRDVSEIVEFGSGARLYVEGAEADACYLLRSGTVKLIRDGGRPQINLALVGAGQMIGDYAMFRGRAHASTAVSTSPVTAVRFERPRVMDALAMRPRIGLRWMMEALGRLEAAHGRLAVILRGSIEARVAAYLLGFDEREIEITHEALAEMVGAERASVSRAIGSLRDSGAITNTRGSIVVLDRAALRRARDRGTSNGPERALSSSSAPER